MQFFDCNFNNFEFNHLGENIEAINQNTITKLTKELSSYKTSLPLNEESSIFVRYDTKDIRKLKALIIGPKNTPYENGIFIFDFFIKNDYPNNPPQFKFLTTGQGRVRFNPNLYVCGKVCLSLLNTWNGYGGERWNKDTSTILQILISIQSLIFTENPFFNEPGHEKNINKDYSERKSKEYNDNIRYQTIKWAMCDVLENKIEEFDEVIKTHFCNNKNKVIETVNQWYSETNISKNNFNMINNKLLKLINNI